MTEHQTSRTLVKSAPELWAECSDAASLARHLGAFGEIRITKLEPETAVAWEGAAVSGTVRLEPSGWGTRVTLTMTEAGGAVVVREPPAPPSAASELVAADAITPGVDAETESDAGSELPVTAPDAGSEPPAVAPDAGSELPAVAPDAAPEPPVTAPPPRMLARLRLALRRRPAAVPFVEEPAEGESPAIEPVAGAPATDPPVADLPATDLPATDLPATDLPATDLPATDLPATDLPATDLPATDLPATDPQVFEAPPETGTENRVEPAAATSRGEPALAAALDSLGRAHHRPYSR